MSPNVAQAISQAVDQASGEQVLTLSSVIGDDDLIQNVEKSLNCWAATIVKLRNNSTSCGAPGAQVKTVNGGFYPAIFPSMIPQDGEVLSTPTADFFRDYYETSRLEDKFKRVAIDCRKRLEARSTKVDQLVSQFNRAIGDSSEEGIQKIRSLADLVTAYLYNWKYAPTGVIGREESLECFDFVTGRSRASADPRGYKPSRLCILTILQSKETKTLWGSVQEPL